jgi:hypothetical protein
MLAQACAMALLVQCSIDGYTAPGPDARSGSSAEAQANNGRISSGGLGEQQDHQSTGTAYERQAFR